MTLTSRFGENLRWHREQADLSQEALAHLADTHRTDISLFERGRREPRLEMLVKLADVLKVDIGELSAGINWQPAGLRKKYPAGRFRISPLPPSD
jgi:transcriptional regulator with XRE-family HTH domain